jgi:DNA-binding NarL/FixJ family response regulator
VGNAATGVETVSEVLRLCPDVVVMDIGMPELNGIDATRLIREKCPECQIVILSVFASSQYIFDALDAGAKGYVLKESAGKEIIEAINAAYEERLYFSRKIANTVVDEYLAYRRDSGRKSPIDRLTMRERQILHLVVEGKSSTEIANMIHISSKTVDTYRSRIMQKLGVSDVPGLVKFAILHGLVVMD